MGKKTNLDKYDYSIEEGFNKSITYITYNTLSKYFYGENCLELGCADGVGTQILLGRFKKVTAVDGSLLMLAKLKTRLNGAPGLTVVQSYFEDLQPDGKFDTIIMTHVLEHVDDPVRVLKVAKSYAQKDTRIIVDVPNAFSIHRQAGKLLGMIEDVHSLNNADKSVGHRRVYDIKVLKRDIRKAGLKIIASGGFLFKPFSNAQMLAIMGNKKRMIDAYSRIGEMYPDIAAEIYAVCRI